MCDHVNDKKKINMQEMGRETGKKYKTKKDRNIGQIFISWYSKSKSNIYYL